MAHPQCHVRVSVSTNTRQEGRTSFHLDSLLMTRMRAPFSSFSRWLSDLSSVRTWEQGKEICVNTFVESEKTHVRCLVHKTERVVQTITWHGVTKSECWQWLCGQNKKRSLPLALVWGDAMEGGGGGMLGTVRHASESRQLQNVRSVMRRCESQKGNFCHDVGHVSREERWLKITTLKCFPSSRDKQHPFNKPRTATNTEQRPCVCQDVCTVMSC